MKSKCKHCPHSEPIHGQILDSENIPVCAGVVYEDGENHVCMCDGFEVEEVSESG